MTVFLETEDKYTLAEFPVENSELEELIQQFDGQTKVQVTIPEKYNVDLPYHVYDRKFTADIGRVNLFAERLEQLDSMEIAVMESLLCAGIISDFEEIITASYSLDSVPVWPCNDSAELTQMAFDNNMLPELRNCPCEIIDLLDTEKVAERVLNEHNAIMIDGYYCEPAHYQNLRSTEEHETLTMGM